jgi:hypothetical protein
MPPEKGDLACSTLPAPASALPPPTHTHSHCQAEGKKLLGSPGVDRRVGAEQKSPAGLQTFIPSPLIHSLISSVSVKPMLHAKSEVGETLPPGCLPPQWASEYPRWGMLTAYHNRNRGLRSRGPPEEVTCEHWWMQRSGAGVVEEPQASRGYSSAKACTQKSN